MTVLLAAAALALSPVPALGELREHPRHRVRAPDPRVEIVRPFRAKLTRMAWCESTGRWWIATGNGYYGGLQFDLQTWRSVGGAGYPHRASRLEQMFRAVRLIRWRGYSPWPVCGSA